MLSLQIFGPSSLLELLVIAVELVIFGGVIYFAVLFALRKASVSPASGDQTPMDILKKRYAQGEVSQEEYDRMRRELE